MSYVVLARKWRPQSFTDLVGQEHVARTLRNSIALDRVAHAFLFTGVRGVGKTTSARILAKALNCEKGPTIEPCLKCPACTEIALGVDMDVLEIDGATYTSVNDIRELQESMPYRPNRDRFKIYIVDEVHMLSSSAWNAFLKTLEEPPPHVKFIFATTEVHKVPVTILSRCQRYDFKLIGAGVIAGRLRHVLGAEGIEAEEGALQVLAREAQGSMRDAMSLLDQVIAWAGETGKLTTDGVCRVLGVADRSSLSRLAEAILKGDASGALGVVGELAEQGYDMVHLARDFATHLRDLVVVKVSRDPKALVDIPESELTEIASLVKDATPEDLTRLHQGLSSQLDDLSKSPLPRAALEMTLVRLALRPTLEPMGGLLRKLADLEARLGGGAAAGGGGGGGQSGAAGAGPSGGPARGGPSRNEGSRSAAFDAPEAEAPPVARAQAPAPAEAPAFVPSRPAPAPAPPPAPPARTPAPLFTPPPFPGARASTPPASTPPPSSPRASSPPSIDPRSFGPPPSSAQPHAPFVNPALLEDTGPLSDAGDAQLGPASSPPLSGEPAGDPFRVDRPSAPPPSGKPPTSEVTRAREAPIAVSPTERATLMELLPVVDLAREKKNSFLASLLERVAVIDLQGTEVRLGVTEKSFEAGQLADAKAKIHQIAQEHFGEGRRVVVEELYERKPTLADLYSLARRERRAKLDEGVMSHPLVVAAQGTLGAELKEIVVPQEIESQNISLV